MMGDDLQLGLPLMAPVAPTKTGRGRVPVLDPPVEPVQEIPRCVGEAHETFERWCREGEAMIFLQGQNPHICAARTYSRADKGYDRWVERTHAEETLRAHGYTLHGIQWQGSGKDARYSKVYTR